MALFLWVIGGVLTFAGLSVFLEFGLAIPLSGGEKNYLERVYRHPRYLATCVLAAQMILLGFSSGNAYAFGRYVLLAAGQDQGDGWRPRGIAIACITFAVALHSAAPKWGLRLVNVLGIFKVVVLVFIVFSGFAALAGRRLVDDPHNFDDAFSQAPGLGTGGVYAYATAILRVVYSYKGWENANYVVGELRNPGKTLAIAAPLAVGGVTILYVLANVAYFAAISKQDLAESEVIVAGIFFRNVFGDSAAARALPAFVALSNLGNVLAVSFAHARLNQEFGKEGLLPFSRFWASIKPFDAPAAAVCDTSVSPSTSLKVFRPDTDTTAPSSSCTGSSPSSFLLRRRPVPHTTSSSIFTRTRAPGSTASWRRACSICSGPNRKTGRRRGTRISPSPSSSSSPTLFWPSRLSSRRRATGARMGTHTTSSPSWVLACSSSVPPIGLSGQRYGPLSGGTRSRRRELLTTTGWRLCDIARSRPSDGKVGATNQRECYRSTEWNYCQCSPIPSVPPSLFVSREYTQYCEGGSSIPIDEYQLVVPAFVETSLASLCPLGQASSFFA